MSSSGSHQITAETLSSSESDTEDVQLSFANSYINQDCAPAELHQNSHESITGRAQLADVELYFEDTSPLKPEIGLRNRTIESTACLQSFSECLKELSAAFADAATCAESIFNNSAKQKNFLIATCSDLINTLPRNCSKSGSRIGITKQSKELTSPKRKIQELNSKIKRVDRQIEERVRARNGTASLNELKNQTRKLSLDIQHEEVSLSLLIHSLFEKEKQCPSGTKSNMQRATSSSTSQDDSDESDSS